MVGKTHNISVEKYYFNFFFLISDLYTGLYAFLLHYYWVMDWTIIPECFALRLLSLILAIPWYYKTVI